MKQNTSSSSAFVLLGKPDPEMARGQYVKVFDEDFGLVMEWTSNRGDALMVTKELGAIYKRQVYTNNNITLHVIP